jgi:hypothetical protein
MWYSDKVGETVPYLYTREYPKGDSPEHISQEGSGLKNFVRDKDCEFVYFHHRPFEGKS